MAGRRRGADRSAAGVRVVRATVRSVTAITTARELFDRPPLPQATARYLRDRRNVLYLALRDRRAVGFLRGTALPQLDTPRPQMFLYEIAVAPRYRRRGVGRALVRRLLEDCRAGGFDEVFVFTSPYNRPAVRLYRASGGRTETKADRMFVFYLQGRAGRTRPSRP